MSPAFLLYILTILLHILIEFISGGGRIYNQKAKITVKYRCEAIYNYK